MKIEFRKTGSRVVSPVFGPFTSIDFNAGIITCIDSNLSVDIGTYSGSEFTINGFVFDIAHIFS